MASGVCCGFACEVLVFAVLTFLGSFRFVGMSVVMVSRPCFGLCGGLVFWLPLGWVVRFLSMLVCCEYVVWDGMRMGRALCWTFIGSSFFSGAFVCWCCYGLSDWHCPCVMCLR